MMHGRKNIKIFLEHLPNTTFELSKSSSLHIYKVPTDCRKLHTDEDMILTE